MRICQKIMCGSKQKIFNTIIEYKIAKRIWSINEV